MSEIESRGIIRTNKIHPQQMVAFFSMSMLYLFYYFCKYNLGVATPGIQKEYGFTNLTFGVIGSAFTLVYAGGQFLNGYLGDRYGPKRIMIIGGFGGVVVSAAFGLTGILPFLPSSMLSVWSFFLVMWGINGYFSSSGWAPGSRIMYNWFPEKRWGTWMGVYNAMCYTGGGLVSIIAGVAIKLSGGNWRAALLVPPVFLVIWTIVFWIFGRNEPKDAGLKTEWEPPHSVVRTRPGRKEYRMVFFNTKMLFANASGFGANFVRWGIISWMVKILSDDVWTGGFGVPLATAAIITSLAHWGGAAFSLVLGYVTDHVFKGMRWQTIVIGFAVGALPLFWMAQGAATIGYSVTELDAVAAEARFGRTVLDELIPGKSVEVHGAKGAMVTTQPTQPSDRKGPVLHMKSEHEFVLVDGKPGTMNLVLLGIAIFIAGGLIQAVQTPLFDLPGDILGEELGGTGVGILDGWMYLGATFAGVFMGWWLDVFSLTAGILLMAVVALVSGVLAIPIRK